VPNAVLRDAGLRVLIPDKKSTAAVGENGRRVSRRKVAKRFSSDKCCSFVLAVVLSAASWGTHR
jgi:hypothetical protein